MKKAYILCTYVDNKSIQYKKRKGYFLYYKNRPYALCDQDAKGYVIIDVSSGRYITYLSNIRDCMRTLNKFDDRIEKRMKSEAYEKACKDLEEYKKLKGGDDNGLL